MPRRSPAPCLSGAPPPPDLNSPRPSLMRQTAGRRPANGAGRRRRVRSGGFRGHDSRLRRRGASSPATATILVTSLADGTVPRYPATVVTTLPGYRRYRLRLPPARCLDGSRAGALWSSRHRLHQTVESTERSWRRSQIKLYSFLRGQTDSLCRLHV